MHISKHLTSTRIVPNSNRSFCTFSSNTCCIKKLEESFHKIYCISVSIPSIYFICSNRSLSENSSSAISNIVYDVWPFFLQKYFLAVNQFVNKFVIRHRIGSDHQGSAHENINLNYNNNNVSILWSDFEINYL
jgi:hypothetical protein